MRSIARLIILVSRKFSISEWRMHVNTQYNSTHSDNHPVNQLLSRLTEHMQAADLWSEQTPSAEALASSLPFCCDTLSFENWLQFVFIPKMLHLLAHRMPMPQSLVIAPMAEQTWLLEPGNIKPEVMAVYRVLQEIDQYFGALPQ